MEKQELLAAVRQMAAVKNLSQEELMLAFNAGAPGQASEGGHEKTAVSLAEIMYYIGAGIVFLGIIILCAQNWDNLSTPVRVLVTLGSSVAAFVIGVLLYRYENFKKISQAFFLIAGVLAPVGLNVALHESGFDLASDTLQAGIYLVLLTVYLGSYYSFRQTILVFFSIVFGTGLFHYIVNMIIGSSLSYENVTKVWEYQILVIGIAYMLLGYYFSSTGLRGLKSFLYSLGSIAFLGAAMALGGWQPDQNVFWELVYPLLVFGVIFLSVHVKSRAFLIFGVLFLIGYILKITSEYFTIGLGWPLALVLAGFAIMGVGFWAVKLNKQYFQNPIA